MYSVITEDIYNSHIKSTTFKENIAQLGSVFYFHFSEHLYKTSAL